jgi:hypothetical protein
MGRVYTVGNLRADLKELEHAEDDEPLVVVIDENAEHLDELEGGAVLDIEEFGGFMAGMRTIRVSPR